MSAEVLTGCKKGSFFRGSELQLRQKAPAVNRALAPEEQVSAFSRNLLDKITAGATLPYLIMSNHSAARRQFLKFLAASPYVASLGGVAAFLRQSALAQSTEPPPSDVITKPADALNVFDFEEAAHRRVLPGHWAPHGNRRR